VRAFRASVILLMAILAACSGTTEPTAAPTAAATPSLANSTGTTAPSEGAEPTEPPVQPCGSGEPPCALPAGAYTTSAFTLTMPAGWLKWTETTEGGELYPAAAATGGIHWMIDPHLPADPSTTPATGAAVRAAMATLFPDATASEVSATAVGGAPAETFDLALGDNDPTEYLAVTTSNFRLGPGEKARFIVAKRGADTVIIVVDAFSSADFDDVVAFTKPLLDSLVWG